MFARNVSLVDDDDSEISSGETQDEALRRDTMRFRRTCAGAATTIRSPLRRSFSGKAAGLSKASMLTGNLKSHEVADVTPVSVFYPADCGYAGPRGCGAVPGPEDVVEGGRLGSVFAEAGEALSAMVLAVHDDLGESFGDGGLGFQEGQVESPLEVAFGQVGDEGQQLFMGGAVELDQLVEAFAALGFLFLVEWPVEEAGGEEALHHDDVVEGLEHLLVVEGVRVGLDGGEEGGVGPGLMADEGSQKVDHGGMILLGQSIPERKHGSPGLSPVFHK